METWLLDRNDVERLLAVTGRNELMRRLVSRLTEGMAEVARGERPNSPARSGFARGNAVPGVFELMPHHEPGDCLTVKTIAYSPWNPERFQMPTILGSIARFDDANGRLVALVDGVLLTAMRTGAASAVASRLLARPDSRTVGMVGAGAQAVTQLHALSQYFPIDEVLVSDTNDRNARSFSRRVAFLELPITLAARTEILARSDIICTATSVEVGKGPVLSDGPHLDHLHVNAVGSDLVGKVELPRSLLERAFVCADHPGQARHEGEAQQLAAGAPLHGLAELCADTRKAVEVRDRVTVFDSTGFSLEDHLALDVFLEAAGELGLGTKVPVEHHPADALDPYSMRDRAPGLVTVDTT